jgi:hypothetical protein
MHDIVGFMIRINNIGKELQRLVRLKQSLINKKLTNRENSFYIMLQDSATVPK